MAAQQAKNDDRRKRVFVGTLPDDFLRINTMSGNEHERQEAADAQAAMALQQQLVGVPFTSNTTGRLTVTIVSAKLVKNYGLTKMDPYVRLRVGHAVYETNTDPNGGRTPTWNRDVQCLLPQGVNSIYVEIFDECSFSVDELIAWCSIPIPPHVMKGETYQDSFPLSGKQGDGLEGNINIVMSYSPTPYGYFAPTLAAPLTAPIGAPLTTPILTIPATSYGMKGIPVAYGHPVVPHPVVSAPPPPQPNPEDIKQMEEMFPNMDKEVIKSVYEMSRYRKDVTVNSLLQMTN